ncbi:hypothetical protein X564_12725 [Pseudoalteromonas agarivorans]|nr:hypothetical protein X564_12725 [Pseudoalteromonas agarivorans]
MTGIDTALLAIQLKEQAAANLFKTKLNIAP